MSCQSLGLTFREREREGGDKDDQNNRISEPHRRFCVAGRVSEKRMHSAYTSYGYEFMKHILRILSIPKFCLRVLWDSFLRLFQPKKRIKSRFPRVRERENLPCSRSGMAFPKSRVTFQATTISRERGRESKGKGERIEKGKEEAREGRRMPQTAKELLPRSLTRVRPAVVSCCLLLAFSTLTSRLSPAFEDLPHPLFPASSSHARTVL